MRFRTYLNPKYRVICPVCVWMGIFLMLSFSGFGQSEEVRYRACLYPSDAEKDKNLSIVEVEPPLPSIFIMPSDSSEYVPGIVSLGHDYLVMPVPDPDFARNFPHDANYMTGRIKLLVQRGEGAPTQVGSFGRSNLGANVILVPISQFKDEFSSGDQLWLAIDPIYRINYRRLKVRVEMPLSLQYISLTVE